MSNTAKCKTVSKAKNLLMEYFGYHYVPELEEFLIYKYGCENVVTEYFVKRSDIINIFNILHDYDKSLLKQKFSFDLEREMDRTNMLIWKGNKYFLPDFGTDYRNGKLF